jgi:putative transposase
VLPGVPCHITQRGVDCRETFSCDSDRRTYVQLLQHNLADAQVRLLGWCLMTNHVHLIAIPERDDSLAVLLRRVHGRYAQYYNTRAARTGHLWQNRYFACALSERHLWTALAYVDRNPVRAGMVRSAGDYRWSSAAAHLSGVDPSDLVDLRWWRDNGGGDGWEETLGDEDPEDAKMLRRCTDAGRPFGDESFIREMAERTGRNWTRGRPPKESAPERAAREVEEECPLFAE